MEFPKKRALPDGRASAWVFASNLNLKPIRILVLLPRLQEPPLPNGVLVLAVAGLRSASLALIMRKCLEN